MTLNERLAGIFPQLDGAAFEVETTMLGGNAWNTHSVLRHRIRLADGSAPLECVEKRINKLPGIGPFEPVMQAWAAAAGAGPGVIRTPYLGVVQTALACRVYSQSVTGPHPHLGRIAPDAGRGIAQLERASMARLSELSALTRARLDFFAPWTLWRPRYNHALALRRRGLRRMPALGGIVGLGRDLQARLRQLAGAAQDSARCLSHLDLLSKNFIETPEGLHLVDWGEARIGRVGFDAGSYLHRLLRGNTLATFEPSRAAFMQAYLGDLAPGQDTRQARRNALYFLTLRTLCYFLRPDVLRQNLGAPQAIEQKLAWLLAAIDQEAVAG